MTRSYLGLMSFLAAAWGASYLFIKVAVDEIPPTTMMLTRIVIAGAVLTGVLAWRGELGQLRAPWQAYALGIFNSAIPFTLIAWGEQHVDSGVAAIANATVPIFVSLLAIRFRPSERARGSRLAGILLGLVGVAVLAGLQPGGGWWAAAGTLAVAGASLSYAVSTLWGQQLIGATRGPVLAVTALAGGALVLAPLGIAEAPHHLPSWRAAGAVLALALLGTAAAQLAWFRLLAGWGSSRASLVTYLLPATALVYGIALLGEPLTIAEIGGLALILAGVALGAGVLRSSRAPAVTQAP